MRSLRVPATVLGRFGGSGLMGKLRQSSERVGLLAQYFRRHRPDALVTLSNAESIRAAFGLKIPIVCFTDVPTARLISRLTLPLASKVCAPWIIPKHDFIRCGVAGKDLFHYRALDPVLWLKDHPAARNGAEPVARNGRRPLVVCRETEWQSSYVDNDIVRTIATEIGRRHPDWRIINIPRYRKHPFYDVPSLLADADLLIGGGGTMCIEAAYFGTPVLATLPIRMHYMQWLFERRLARKCSTVADGVRWAEKIIAARGTGRDLSARRRARRLFGKMTFPLRAVSKLIQAAASRSSSHN
jgi:predicted glycosyltransferase